MTAGRFSGRAPRGSSFPEWCRAVSSASGLSLALLLTAGAALHAGPEIPGAPIAEPVAIIGGTIHTVSGDVIENGTLLFHHGKIVAVGAGVAVPADAMRIDAAGKHVYPGLFDAYTSLGLVEIPAVRATVDERETGQLNPNVRSWVAVNPDSELIPVTRSNGVLLALSAPNGSLIAGKSAVLQLDGWTWEDMTLRPDVGLHVHWPNMTPVIDWETERSAREQTQDRDEALRRLRQAFDDARAYVRSRDENPRQAFDARWEAMRPVLSGELPLIVAADELQQIQAAIAFAQQRQLKMILYGGYDAPLCTELLKQHDIPVIVAGVYRLPLRRSEPYDMPFTVPARLQAAGVRFCISESGRFGAANARNLPYHAAMAAAFGLEPHEALKSITLYPAQILGVGQRVGSLEPSKDATLIITDGNPLETATHVEAAFIQGRPVDLDNRHRRLWRKYEEKYRRLQPRP